MCQTDTQIKHWHFLGSFWNQNVKVENLNFRDVGNLRTRGDPTRQIVLMVQLKYKVNYFIEQILF